MQLFPLPLFAEIVAAGCVAAVAVHRSVVAAVAVAEKKTGAGARAATGVLREARVALAARPHSPTLMSSPAAAGTASDVAPQPRCKRTESHFCILKKR